MRKCENCKHYFREQPTHCRLIPPAAIDATNASFALTQPTWWCGQHEWSWRAVLRYLFTLGRGTAQ